MWKGPPWQDRVAQQPPEQISSGCPGPVPPTANKEGCQVSFLFYSHDSHPVQLTFYMSFKKMRKL